MSTSGRHRRLVHLPVLAAGALAACVLTVRTAEAGRNANAAIIVHTHDAYTFSENTVCADPAGLPASCSEAGTTSTRESGAAVWLLAAFHETMDPSVLVIYFGIDYDGRLDPVSWRLCGSWGSFEIPDEDWPHDGKGNSVAFGSPVAGQRIFPFYAFRVEGGVPGAHFRSAVNPTGGYAAFVDDGNPPAMDLCDRFGTVRWFSPGGNECPDLEPEACCFPDGGCQPLFADACRDEGGIPFGSGTNCSPNPCQQPGACCDPSGSCAVLPLGLCEERGGRFLGIGMSCDPNPCATGACCYPNGSCETAIVRDCEVTAGTFRGEGIACDPNPCEQPGACCLPAGGCLVTSASACASVEGSFLGVGSACMPDPCPHPPTGACCTGDGFECRIMTAETCADLRGTYEGDDTTCRPANPCPQACCFGWGECRLLRPSECAAQQGILSPWTACDSNPCPGMETCCFSADETCILALPDSCVALGGEPTFESACVPNPCLVHSGACCLEGNVCVLAASAEECAAMGGSFHLRTDCATGVCPEACCLPNGSCVDLRPSACHSRDGYPGGRGSVCDPSPCSGVEACCRMDGSCFFVTPEECDAAGGVSGGPGSVCLPDPCEEAQGACCDGYGVCLLLTATDCGRRPGTMFLGYGTTCDPNSCPPPNIGACCLENHECEVLSTGECADRGGWFVGEDVDCDWGPCDDIPVERTTWGRIRARFR